MHPHLLESFMNLVGLGGPSTSIGLYESVRSLIAAFLIFSFIMTAVLFLILGLRKFLGFLQSRLGPNRVGGPLGLGQTMMDALKLLTKEDIVPAMSDHLVFNLAPVLVFVPAFMVYVVIPWTATGSPKDLDVGIIYIAAVTSIQVIGIVMAGWSANNKYSQLGAFRSAGQMISYEVPMVLALVAPVIAAGTFSLQGIVRAQLSTQWYILVTPIAFIVYMVAGLAETNLTPFDLVEAESELIAGFTTEYSGMKFALFYLAEFAGNFTVGAIGTTLFLGGWSMPFGIPGGWPWFIIKSSIIVLGLFWVRGTLPRVRVDQLMDLGWKFLIPAALFQLLVIALYVAVGWPYWAVFIINVVVLIVVLALGGMLGLLPSRDDHVRDIRTEQRRKRALI